MLGGHESFDKRVQMLERARQRAPKGRMHVVGPDGVIFVKKRRAVPAVSLRGLTYLVVGFALFKALAVAQFGLTGYAERVESLRQGTMIEQAGAVLMQPDRLSTAISKHIAPFIH